jgi:dihydroorotate dehydrogenase (NAD+) catalytic subunit
MSVKLSVNIGKLKLKNPVMVASGTFGYAEEFKDLMGLKPLGALVSKTITLRPRRGNPPPRTCETPCGMLNSVGLENPGVETFLKEKLPALAKIGVPLIVSIASEKDPKEFVNLAQRLDQSKEVAAIELNISCPNIQRERLISQDPKATSAVVGAVRRVTKKTLITKLSPNVTDIAEMALAAEAAGSDAVSLINTLSGMSIDTRQRTPKLACVTGGLSGPSIRPVAVRMVWEVFQKIRMPIIGMGGIMDISSALEFFIAGASAVAIGTGNFVNPACADEVIIGLKKYMAKNKIKDIKGLTGSLTIEE